LILLGACGKDDGINYCKNHDKVHADHADTIANLIINVSAAGDLEGSLSIPEAALGDSTAEEVESILSSAGNSFTLQTEHPCTVAVTTIATSAGGVNASYTASCGADNKLGKINASLFDSFDQLDEVVTSMTTAVTSKRFAISRQCDSPIFKLDRIN
jgi:hypothetical protein